MIYLGEFIGTLVLMVFGAGFGASISLNKSMSKGMNPSWLTVAIAWGFAVMLALYAAGPFGSGGHLNPAVTLAQAFNGMFPWDKVPGYILAQIAGAFAGSAIVVLHYYPHFKETKADEGNSVGIFATGAAIDNPTFNFISEVIATFFFLFGILTIGAHDLTAGLIPVVLGFLVMGLGLSLGSTTGYCMNPARDFGPRLAYALLPIPNKGDANWGYAWIPFCGPIVGATLAVAIHAAIMKMF